MAAVQFQCPHCAGLFQIDQSQTGQEVACPTCGGVTFVPAAAPQPVPAAPAAPPTDLGCPICSGVFQVTAGMAGQPVACPHCQSTVEVPAQLGAAALPPAPPAPSFPGLPGGPSLPNISTGPKIGPPAGFVAPQPAPPEPTFPQPAPLPEIHAGAAAAQPPAPQLLENPPLPENPPSLRNPAGESAPTQPPPTQPPPTQPADDMLPPPVVAQNAHAADVPTPPVEETPPPTEAMLPPAVEMLPPAAGPAPSVEPSPTPEEPLPSSDDFLPPTAHDASSEVDSTAVVANEPAAIVPTADGGYVALHEPKKTVARRGRQIELRQLSPKEKGRRRLIKNVVMGVLGMLFLLGALLVLNHLTGQGL